MYYCTRVGAVKDIDIVLVMCVNLAFFFPQVHFLLFLFFLLFVTHCFVIIFIIFIIIIVIIIITIIIKSCSVLIFQR